MVVTTNAQKFSLIVTSLPFQNDLDRLYGPGGPWDLKVANVALYENLMENVKSNEIKSVYFLVYSKWATALEEKINEYCDKKNIQIDLVFVPLESNIWNLGDALRSFQSNFMLQEPFVLFTMPTMFQFPLDKVTNIFNNASDNTILACLTYHTTDDNCLMVTSCNKVLWVNPYGEDLEISMQLMKSYKKLGLVQKYRLPTFFICKPNVLSFFQDNFDCITMHHLINWITSNEEILGLNVIYNELDSYTVSPVTPEQYFSLNKDVFNGYTDLSDRVQQNAKHDTKNGLNIQAGSFIDNSSEIGSDSTFISSFVDQSATIGENSILKNCIICKGATVGRDSHLTNIILPPLKSLPPNSNDNFQIPTIYTMNESTGENSESLIAQMEAQHISMSPIETDQSKALRQTKSESSIPESDAINSFKIEVLKLLKLALGNNNMENVNIDIQLVRNDFDFEPDTFHHLVILCLCEFLTSIYAENKSSMGQKEALIDSITKFQCVFEFYMNDLYFEINALDTMAHYSTQDEMFLTFLPTFLYELYDREVISEEAVLSWYDELDDDDYPAAKKSLSSFVSFLKESE